MTSVPPTEAIAFTFKASDGEYDCWAARGVRGSAECRDTEVLALDVAVLGDSRRFYRPPQAYPAAYADLQNLSHACTISFVPMSVSLGFATHPAGGFDDIVDVDIYRLNRPMNSQDRDAREWLPAN